MLRIGLTGGIGAGKSSVAATFAECGAIVVDSDVLAREVVEPGTEGLAALVRAFGDDIVRPDGWLDRQALAAKAFSSDDNRATLNAIVHPLVARRRAELLADVPADAVVVEDIPLLVESSMAPFFPLVVVVDADAEVRVARLVEHRGMAETDARARVAAQATDAQRRAAADIWLDNSGTPEALAECARQVWINRIEPFARNLRTRRVVAPASRVIPADPAWAAQAARIVARIKAACGARAVRVDHVGPTAVPGLAARDVIDVQVTVDSLAVAEDLDAGLLAAGYPRIADVTEDAEVADARSTRAGFDHRSDPGLWRKRVYGSADPGRPTYVHVRVDGWPNQQYALLVADWLTADPAERDAYQTALHAHADEQWLHDAYRRAWHWADRTDWRP
ncbi:dephospho-CoA kinase [Mycobacterium sp.]|uniref:dephospho-CoA kinase n=1 Tax=Mycobacterium sp. TaxID=1785 RepID=UPI00127C378D|nr:dephospho-CoA kinase [Mycobacterium sp.]KAA8969717.1 MAG: dephospho-CoA kinase [Mycobacterium sp.]